MYLTRNQAYVFKRTEGSNPPLRLTTKTRRKVGFFYFYSSAVGLSCLRVNVSLLIVVLLS